jgi:peroxiredoxin (alkyl hydroperoxide reductase subunit C)|uniref:2-Cys peroxiredoxin n=1 Tax=Paralia sulcata TaxID=216927 RepID=UPI0022F2F023|nr:2-Cys peroxiredoxin [Paralia sulcata]WAJ57867.1 2-Cys peroxiredoxin [Paralia sulcata]
MVNYLQIGKSAPNFLTVSVYKKKLGKIRLSDYRGKKYVILVFYPANFTPVSPTELLALSDRIKEFQKLSAQILAISVDSPFSHLRWLLLSRNEGGLQDLNYPLVSDLTQTITSDYKLLTNDGIALPGLFIIDKEGVIQYYTVNNLLCGRNTDEILRILKSIQYIKKHPGQACPVDWNFGDQVLYSHPIKSKIYFRKVYCTEQI